MLPDFELSCFLFSKYGFDLDEEKYHKLLKYSDLLVEWNQKINLTAITEPRDILVKHFLDSLMILKFCDIPKNSSLIDVGTGAGFPSVPIKIFRPDIKLTLLDSLAKRITFLEELCGSIDIDAEFVHGRAEEIAKIQEYREKFDFSCARAVAGMSVLSEYCIPFVQNNGHFISMKGQNEDISSSEASIRLLGGEIFKTEDYEVEAEKRRIIVVKKISQTPTKYPRNSAQIKKKPL